LQRGRHGDHDRRDPARPVALAGRHGGRACTRCASAGFRRVMATETTNTDGMPAPGAPAPDFTLATDEGSDLALRDLRGQKVVLYFYPKDDTPGCTKQACGLRD